MAIHIQSFTINHFPSLMIAMSKPAYIAIKEYSPNKPVIVFVPSRRQCRLTVDDILTHCSADDQPDLFLNIELADLQPHLDHINDKGLAETLKHGIGYYHEALDKQDKRIVQRLFESGAIQVLVASKVLKFLIVYQHTLIYNAGHCMELTCVQLYGNHNGCAILRGQGAQVHRLPGDGRPANDG